jgi:hypothetical protein
MVAAVGLAIADPPARHGFPAAGFCFPERPMASGLRQRAGRGSDAADRGGRRTCRKEPTPYLRLAAALLPELVAGDALDGVGDEDLAEAAALLRRLDDKRG